MTLTVFLAVLFAALMHAGWNAVVRAGGDRFQNMLILTVSQGLMGCVMAIFAPLPSGQAWLWLVASGLFHTAYKLFLASAYQRGDLSRVYPIARGAAPMMVVVVGFFLLSDPIAGQEYLGVGLIGVGVMLMAQGVFSSGEARSLIPFALGSAACTAGYTMVDGVGARVMGSATGYTAWLFVFDFIFFSFFTTAVRGTTVFRATRQRWAIGTLAGGMSLVTYWIAVWAMTVAPIALVAAVRETSVLFAVLIGVIWMKEKANMGKLIAALVILAGVITLRL